MSFHIFHHPFSASFNGLYHHYQSLIFATGIHHVTSGRLPVVSASIGFVDPQALHRWFLMVFGMGCIDWIKN